MSVYIEDHDDNTYTVTFNESIQIRTVVTSSGDDVVRWISETLRYHYCSQNIVGLDVEWRPNFGRYDNPVAVLQLCIGRRCLVFQILHADYIPDILYNFLERDDFTFLGVGIDQDVEKLYSDYYLCVMNTLDLRVLAEEVMEWSAVRRMGLKALAFQVMDVDVYKPRRITLSRWDYEELSYSQVKYACVDAYLSYEIGRRLYDGEF